MSLPGKYSFTLARGKDFSRPFTRKVKETGAPVDYTGLKVRCQIRTIDGQFGTTTTTTLVLDLLNGAGIAITDPPGGKITLTLTAAQTIVLCPTNAKTKLAYEIEIYNDNTPPETVIAFLQGHITVLPEIAR